MSASERNRTVGVAAVFAASATMLALSPASAAPEPSARTVQIIGDERFLPDEFFTQTFRFSPRRIRVHSGDTITWNTPHH